MKPAKGIAMAIGVGYLVVSRYKLRAAAMASAVAAEALARTDGGGGGGGGGGAEGGGAFKKLGVATVAAARTALSKPAERLASRLNDSAEALRQGSQQPADGRPKETGEGDGAGEHEAAGEDVGAGPDEGHLRKGKYTSRGVKYSQEITSPDEDPERPGRSLATTHHGIIKEWAETRGATPATVKGTEHPDHLGVLRFDFGGHNENLRHVSWAEWFDTFDSRRLNFIYQEERSDGRRSNFFRLDNPDREE